MKVRKSELWNMRKIIESYPKGKYAKFNHAVSKNLRLIKEAIWHLEDSIQPEKELREFEKEKRELAIRFSKKEGGAPMTVPTPDGGQRYLIEDARQKEFDQEFEKLKEKYKTVLDTRDEQMDEYSQYLRESEEINFHLINLEDVPDDLSPLEREPIVDWIIEEGTVAEAVEKAKADKKT